VTPTRGTEYLVRCACDEVTLTGRAPKASLAVTMWNDAVTEWHAEDEARDGEMDDAAERRAAIADRKYDEWKDRQMEGDEC
jgi:glycerol kinase